MKIDFQRAKQLINGARQQAVDATILPKSASQKDKEETLHRITNNLKVKMRNKECIIIVIEAN